jgi:hypothetical protein
LAGSSNLNPCQTVPILTDAAPVRCRISSGAVVQRDEHDGDLVFVGNQTGSSTGPRGVVHHPRDEAGDEIPGVSSHA